MAYCDKCGAYIPDGQTKCLACGYDADEVKEAAEAATASATQSDAGQKTHIDSEFLRRQLEQQRQKQRENTRQWAEKEAARRRQQQSESNQNADFSQQPFTQQNSRSKSKTFAALSYLGILCFLPMIACNDDEFAMFHARQGLGLFLVALAGNVLSAMLGFSWLVTLGWVYMIYKGMTAASAGRKEPLPYIGNLFMKK